jgi:Na+/H+ antiporter NhaC
MSSERIISSSAALVVLVLFFLPWIAVSCGNQEIATVTGYELATGTEIDLGVGVEEREADSTFFVVPLAAVIVIGLVLVSSIGRMTGSVAAAGEIAAATIGLILLAFKWLEARREAAESIPDTFDFSFSPEIGLWAVVLGLVLIIVGATISLFDRKGAQINNTDESSYSIDD